MRALAGVGVLAGLGLVSAEAVRSRRLAAALRVARAEACRDELSGLLNRAGIGRQVEEMVARDRRAALLLVDLDGFKAVNDTYGHLAGDQVLAAVGRRIAAVLVGEELAARHGGDEFTVLTPAREDPWVPSRRAAVAAAVKGPVCLPDGTEVEVAGSVGVAVAGDVRELWEVVDRTMYADKAARRARRRSHVEVEK